MQLYCFFSFRARQQARALLLAICWAHTAPGALSAQLLRAVSSALPILNYQLFAPVRSASHRAIRRAFWHWHLAIAARRAGSSGHRISAVVGHAFSSQPGHGPHHRPSGSVRGLGLGRRFPGGHLASSAFWRGVGPRQAPGGGTLGAGPSPGGVSTWAWGIGRSAILALAPFAGQRRPRPGWLPVIGH